MHGAFLVKWYLVLLKTATMFSVSRVSFVVVQMNSKKYVM